MHGIPDWASIGDELVKWHLRPIGPQDFEILERDCPFDAERRRSRAVAPAALVEPIKAV
jgi:hypothetical protein